MIKEKVYFAFWSLLFLFMVFSFSLGQQQQEQEMERPPWNERSPAVGKKVPDFMVYDKDIKNIPFSNLYKDTLLIVQWGGCT